MDAIETIQHEGHRIEVFYDPDPQNPREWGDNLGTFQIYSRRYASPDKIVRDPPAIHADEIGLKVWGYDHGGVTYQTGQTNPFHCPWDSGFAGIIFVSKAKAREWFGVKRLTKKVVSQIEAALANEVETYNRYINGEYYGYRTFDANDEEVDACWGFDDKDYMIEEAKANV